MSKLSGTVFLPWLADEIVFEGKAVFDFEFILVIYPPTILGG